jgi:hypothetical protein
MDPEAASLSLDQEPPASGLCFFNKRVILLDAFVHHGSRGTVLIGLPIVVTGEQLLSADARLLGLLKDVFQLEACAAETFGHFLYDVDVLVRGIPEHTHGGPPYESDIIEKVGRQGRFVLTLAPKIPF